MIKQFLVFSIILSVFPGARAQEQAIQLKTKTGIIYGELMLPEEENNDIPLVLMVAGSGPTDGDGNQPVMKTNALKMLAQQLYRNGIASVRFDKRGIGMSEAAGRSEGDLRFEDYVDDVRDWIDFLVSEKKYGKIFVAGHSEGSLIGILACENNENIAGFISIAGTAFPADEIIKKQMASQPQDIQNAFLPILNTLKKGQLVEDVPQMFYSLFRPSVQPYLISWMKYDPSWEFRKLTVPSLVVHGTTDIQVSVENAVLLAKANPKAAEVIIENMNHVLKYCDTRDQYVQMTTYQNPEFPLHEDLVKKIVAFIKKTE